GICTTNAHAVLEEAPVLLPTDSEPRLQQLLVLSAKTETALEAATQNLAQHLRQTPDVNLADVAFTLQVGRQAFNHRRILVCRTCEQAITALENPQPPNVFTQKRLPQSRSVVFMFSGQGSQYVNMARDLYQDEAHFREQVDYCAQILEPHLQLDLRQLIYPDPDQAQTASQKLKQTAITQPALFVIEYALARLLITWGIQPQAMIGHSIGEYVAACLAGVFSLEDALALVAIRGQMMQSLPDGSLLAVFLPQEAIASLLNSELSLASSNSPTVSAVSGTPTAIDALEKQLQTQGIDYRRLQTSHAFHSQMMEPILADFTDKVSEFQLNSPEIPYVSNVTGTWITTEEATDPGYWARHLRQTVRFSEGVEMLLQDPARILLEVGPGSSLRSLAKHQPAATECTILSSIHHPKEEIADDAFLLKTLGQLWLAGVEVDWSKLHQPQSRQRLSLPTYPFERQRYWVEPQATPQQLSSAPNLSEQIADLLEQSDQFSDEETKMLHKLLSRHQKPLEQTVNPDWFYQLEWLAKPNQTQDSRSTNRIHSSGRWLILADRGGIGQKLATQLAQRNQNCILVYAGDTYQQQNARTWQLNPVEPEHFRQLLQDEFKPDAAWQGVIHLWSLDTASTKDFTPTVLKQSQILSVGSALHLLQALCQYQEKIAPKYPPKLWLVTQNTMPIGNSQSTLAVAQAPLWGLGKGIALEHSTLWGGLIDLGDEIPEIAPEILASDGEDQLAFRGNQRYVARLVRFPQSQSDTVTVHPEATYLITGGLGSIGLQIAEWLVERGARYLMLVGRRPPSQPAQNVITKLQESGANVAIAQADIAEFDALTQVFERIKTSMPALGGIVHAAGVPGYLELQNTTWANFESICRPKVNGTWNLHQLTQGLTLDFFLCVSSIASVWGAKGQASYAAANHFLDIFAHLRRQLGQSTLSINFGPWAESGMGSASVRDRLNQMGVKLLPSAKAIITLETLLSETPFPFAQAIVADIDWSIFQPLYEVTGSR
ncbi:MAG: type I polyketide synthase, partial [Cyanobacteriota bacterium]|nr:type I polyketide synthase [Cyanobacteriota bacterium]